MQNAQALRIRAIEGLVQENEIDLAIKALLDLDEQTEIGIRQDVILASGSYRGVAKQYQQKLLSPDEYFRFTAQTRYALTEIMKDVTRKAANSKNRGVNAFQFEVPDDVQLEKLFGEVSNLVTVDWLDKARAATRAVCRVVCADGSLGTGFLTKEGYVFTNHHVIGTAEVAGTARLEFNYEVGQSVTAYQIDPSDFKTSPVEELDFARLKVIDRADAQLSQWGFVEFETQTFPIVGEAVTIIQHPRGQLKQIWSGDVLGMLNQHLFYPTETGPGSSGSPVLNKDCKVVAIHHGGKSLADGGWVVNANGDRKSANRGILFSKIFEFIGK